MPHIDESHKTLIALNENMNNKLKLMFGHIYPQQVLEKNANYEHVLDAVMAFVSKEMTPVVLEPIKIIKVEPEKPDNSIYRFDEPADIEVLQDATSMKVTWLFSDPNLYNDNNTLKKLEKDLKSVYPKLTITCQSSSTVGNLPPCDKVVLFFFISGSRDYNGPIKNTVEQIKRGLPNTPVELVVLRDCRMDKVELSIGNVDVTSKEIFAIYTAVSGMPMALVFEKPKNYSMETFDKAVDNYKKIKDHLKKLHK